ncbi:MAG: ParB/RepB/Spo0J family partition protein [Alphaproteobacteria bacterium]
MTTTSIVRNIPLDRLTLSPANVRKTPPSAAEDAELKASIRAGGLKQNLIVCPAADKPEHFAVTAGGRRFKALQELAAEGAIAGDREVPCLVEEPDTAIETSLMENTVRAAMHPADEFTAMAALIDSGATVEAVATRFGVSERHVRQRLKLGKLAPELLDAFRAGKLSLEIASAFTLGADHPAQLAVWGQIKDQHYVSAHQVRRLLTGSAVPLDSDLGLFVGVEAYEKAGGQVTRDLFSTEDKGFLDDAALVNRLAIEKLEQKAAELRANWAWAKAVLDPDYGFLSQYRRIEPQPAEYSPEIAAELDRIEARLEELGELPDEELGDDLMMEAARLEERRDEIVEATEAEEVYSEADRKRAGVIVTVGDEGGFLIHRGLIERTPGAVAADTGEQDDSAPDGGDAGGSSDGSRTVTRFMSGQHSRAMSPEQQIRKQCGFSQGHIDDLKAYRLQITRAYLAGDFAVAFDLALYALCTDLIGHGYRDHSLDLRATETPLRSTLNDLAATPADRLLTVHETALDTAWLDLPPAQGFAALSVLPAEAKQRLFAWCIALMLKPQLAIEDGADPVIEAAGRRLAIPFADLWRPTALNYWGRVRKAHALDVAKEILGPRWARDHELDRKPVLAEALETAFDPEASAASIHLEAVRDQAAAWLPPGFAFAETVAEAEPATETAVEEHAEDAANDPEPVDAGENEESDDIPAFLTGDVPEGARPNGAALP